MQGRTLRLDVPTYSPPASAQSSNDRGRLVWWAAVAETSIATRTSSAWKPTARSTFVPSTPLRGTDGEPHLSAPPGGQARRPVAAAVAVAVALGVVLVGALVVAPVHVTRVDLTSADDACGSNGQTLPGFATVLAGSSERGITIWNGNPLACTIGSVAATTAGFSLQANTPLVVSAGGSATLRLLVHAPLAGYTGVLTIDVE